MLYVYEIYPSSICNMYALPVYVILTSTRIKICSSKTAWYKGKHTKDYQR